MDKADIGGRLMAGDHASGDNLSRNCFARSRVGPVLGLFLAMGSVITGAQEKVSVSREDHAVVRATAYSLGGGTCRGIAVISPGAGGSESGYRYLGEAMASGGYLAVVVGHQESGRRALREHVRGTGLRDGVSALITDPGAYRGRFMDIAAVRQWAASRCTGTYAVLIGHSMGAATTMIEAGAKNLLELTGNNAFDAYIALSPQGAGAIFPENAWRDIERPVLSVTGTRDEELGGASWKTRTEPYASLPAGCKWLAVVEGATHMNFAGRGMSRGTEVLTTEVIGSFVDAARRGDCRVPGIRAGIDVASK